MKRHCWVLAALMLGLVGCGHAQTRAQVADEPDTDNQDIKCVKVIKDVTRVGEAIPVQVSGVGLVANLEGTGGGAPAGQFKQLLEELLHKEGIRNAKELLASPNYAMVLVTARLAPGVRRGDPLDIEVLLPPQSKATSLRGGYLLETDLKPWDTKRNLNKDYTGKDAFLPGHVLAKAHGPLLVGFGEGNEEVRLRRGRIWEGGRSSLDMPVYLYLNNDQRFASVANAIATKINAAFPDEPHKQARVDETKNLWVLDRVTSQINAQSGQPRGETAKAVGKENITIKLPYEYRGDPERYLRVVGFIPLNLTGEQAGKYRKRLQEMLLDPKDTIRAALRLEALGRESVPALRRGLGSNSPLVRFASAEALTYLGSTSGVDELARLADEYECLRGHCLVAMTSLDEAITQTKLSQLTISPKAELRYGAFRSLLSLNEAHSDISGEKLNDAYWLHRVAVTSTPLVHISTSRRAEIVIFGQAPLVAAPFRVEAGTECTVTADADDTRCTVSRFAVNAGIKRKQCSFQLDDILRTLAALGAEYPDAVEFLRQLERTKCLSCPVKIDALPVLTDVEVLACAGRDASAFKSDPAVQQAVLIVQQELGMSPGSLPASRPAVGGQR